MSKCLFVNPLGNGVNLVAYFKERGHEVYALLEVEKAREVVKSSVSNGQDKKFDTKFYDQRFFNIEQVLESGIAFDCVIPGCESGVESCDILAHKLGLSGNNHLNTAFRRDKFAMQEQLKLNDLPYAKSVLIDLAEDREGLREKLKDFVFPIVLKPTYGTGTQDVFYCNSIEDIKERLDGIEYGAFNWTFSQTTHFVAQEYLVGDEYALDYVVHEGVAHICVVSKYLKNFQVDNKYLTTESVFYSSDDERFASLIAYGKAVLNALEVTNSAAHVEFISNGDKHYLIDLGARMRGGGDTWFYREIYSIGLLEAIYDKYINNGENLKDSILIKHGIHSALNASIDGTFSGISLEEQSKLDELPLLKELTLDLEKGQTYQKTIDLISSKGVATIIGDDRRGVEKTARAIYLILEKHLGDWYRKIPAEIESCNQV